LHDLEDLHVAIDIDDLDSVTVAGLVSELLGRVPVIGDEVSTAGYILRVDEISGRSVRRVTIGQATMPPAALPPER
jgi:CBS domain containing-hemolysin-like protein